MFFIIYRQILLIFLVTKFYFCKIYLFCNNLFSKLFKVIKEKNIRKQIYKRKYNYLLLK